MLNNKIDIKINPLRDHSLVNNLTLLWEDSVKASHNFLSEEDIQKLIPFVKMGIEHIPTLVVAYDNKTPIAFMGIDEKKIEMLFVLSQLFGNGIGQTLVELAFNQYSVLYVDVNEQNPTALKFYQHKGFEVYERTELDEQGNPFPILKMKLK